MTWIVYVFEAQDPRGITVFDVVATNQEPEPGENPDRLIGVYESRLRARVAARCAARRLNEERGKIIPFPKQGRAA